MVGECLCGPRGRGLGSLGKGHGQACLCFGGPRRMEAAGWGGAGIHAGGDKRSEAGARSARERPGVKTGHSDPVADHGHSCWGAGHIPVTSPGCCSHALPSFSSLCHPMDPRPALSPDFLVLGPLVFPLSSASFPPGFPEAASPGDGQEDTMTRGGGEGRPWECQDWGRQRPSHSEPSANGRWTSERTKCVTMRKSEQLGLTAAC